MSLASMQRQDAAFTDDPADALFEMANLFPRTTGLPLTVWVSPRGGARHDARVKVSLAPGRMDVTNTAVVAIRPEPHLVAGDLAAADFAAVARWITLNRAVLIEFWDEQIDSAELGARLVRLDQGAGQP
jgi:hypothetical protein